MPPYGLFDPPDIRYRPIAILDAKMEIDGHEISPVRPDQVRSVVKHMVEQDGVIAFAVTGYASHVNPAHELQVKAIIQQETGFTVTCGHEVSDGVNYRVRSTTAALNARIIPCLEALLDDVQRSLRCREIGAPVMVVRSDGSLMNIESARRRPIETILSGPAASVAGASYLSQATNALVVDIGGTTTDTAVIKNGVGPYLRGRRPRRRLANPRPRATNAHGRPGWRQHRSLRTTAARHRPPTGSPPFRGWSRVIPMAPVPCPGWNKIWTTSNGPPAPWTS